MSNPFSGSSSSKTIHETHESEAHWFPHHPSSCKDALTLALREQKVEFEEKLVNVRQETVKLHQEVLALRELLLKVTEDHNKIKPILDDRKRNALLRSHQPFPFIPEHTRSTNSQQSKIDSNKTTHIT